MASNVGSCTKQRMPQKRSVTPSRVIYRDYTQAYSRITSGASDGLRELDKILSPSPGQKSMNNPFQKLDPSCKDLLKVPEHMTCPGPLSPSAAEQISNQEEIDNPTSDVETERSSSPLSPPTPVAQATSPSPAKVIDSQHISRQDATLDPKSSSEFNTSTNKSTQRSLSTTCLPLPVRLDRLNPQRTLSRSQDTQGAESPSAVTLMTVAHANDANDTQSNIGTVTYSPIGNAPTEPPPLLPLSLDQDVNRVKVFRPMSSKLDRFGRSQQCNTQSVFGRPCMPPTETQKASNASIECNDAPAGGRKQGGDFFRDLSRAELNILQKVKSLDCSTDHSEGSNNTALLSMGLFNAEGDTSSHSSQSYSSAGLDCFLSPEITHKNEGNSVLENDADDYLSTSLVWDHGERNHDSKNHTETTSQLGNEDQWETVGDFDASSELPASLMSLSVESSGSVADMSSEATSSLSSYKSKIIMGKRIPQVPWDPIGTASPVRRFMDICVPTLPAPTMVKGSRRLSSHGQYHHPRPLLASHIHPLGSRESTGKFPISNPFADPKDDDAQEEPGHKSLNKSMQTNRISSSPLSVLSKMSYKSIQSPANFSRRNPRTPQKTHDFRSSPLRHASSDSSIAPMISPSPARARGKLRYQPMHNRSDTEATSWYAMQVQAARDSFDNDSMVTIDLENAPAVTCPRFDVYTPSGHGMKISPGDIPLQCIVPFQSAYCYVHHRREFPIPPTLRGQRDDNSSDDARLRHQRKTGKRLIRIFTVVPFVGWSCLVLVAMDHSLAANIMQKATRGSVKEFYWRERQAAKRRCVFVAVVCALAVAVLVAVTVSAATDTGKTWQPD